MTKPQDSMTSPNIYPSSITEPQNIEMIIILDKEIKSLFKNYQ
jgi:hypothetical protein